MLRAVLGIFVVLSLAATAHAQPGRTPPAGPPPPATYVPPPASGAPVQTRTEHYGTKVAAVDALAAGLIVLGAVVAVSGIVGSEEDLSDDGGMFTLGLVMMIGGTGVYAFGPAFVHSKHHNNSSAWKSVALRLGLPVLGGVIGDAMTRNRCTDEYGYEYDCGGSDAGSSLAGLGVLGAMVIDWAVLSKHEVPVQQPYYPYAAPVAGGGGTFGVAGAF